MTFLEPEPRAHADDDWSYETADVPPVDDEREVGWGDDEHEAGR